MLSFFIAWIALLLAMLGSIYLDPGQDIAELHAIVELNLWLAHHRVYLPR